MKWHVVLLMLFSVLFFIGGLSADSYRVYQEIWDVGHAVFFAYLIWVLLHTSFMQKQHWFKLFLFTTVFCLFIGWSIELIQLQVGRSFEMKDILNDLLGGYLALLLFVVIQVSCGQSIRVALCLLMLSIFVWVVMPTTMASYDEYVMHKDFPVLADFETPFELSRWKSQSGSLFVVDDKFRSGSKSMRIDLFEGKYPGITLAYFSGDWRDYTSIEFSIFNASDDTLSMELKINDAVHRKLGQKFSDRFNRELSLKPGWNDFSIPLQALKTAPEGREMDLSDIAGVSWFLHRLQQPVSLYIDQLRLVE